MKIYRDPLLKNVVILVVTYWEGTTPHIYIPLQPSFSTFHLPFCWMDHTWTNKGRPEAKSTTKCVWLRRGSAQALQCYQKTQVRLRSKSDQSTFHSRLGGTCFILFAYLHLYSRFCLAAWGVPHVPLNSLTVFFPAWFWRAHFFSEKTFFAPQARLALQLQDDLGRNLMKIKAQDKVRTSIVSSTTRSFDLNFTWSVPRSVFPKSGSQKASTFCLQQVVLKRISDCMSLNLVLTGKLQEWGGFREPDQSGGSGAPDACFGLCAGSDLPSEIRLFFNQPDFLSNTSWRIAKIQRIANQQGALTSYANHSWSDKVVLKHRDIYLNRYTDIHTECQGLTDSWDLWAYTKELVVGWFRGLQGQHPKSRNLHKGQQTAVRGCASRCWAEGSRWRWNCWTICTLETFYRYSTVLHHWMQIQVVGRKKYLHWKFILILILASLGHNSLCVVLTSFPQSAWPPGTLNSWSCTHGSRLLREPVGAHDPDAFCSAIMAGDVGVMENFYVFCSERFCYT